MSTRPRYIAVEGPPGAGVGVVAERLSRTLGARLVRDPASENPFLGRFAAEPQRFAFQAQVFFLLSRFRQQGELLQEDLFSRGGVVADYLFTRDRLWARLTLSCEELALYERIHSMLGARVPRPDLVVYLTARPEVLRARIKQRVKETDRVIESGLIDEIAQAMSGFFFRYEDCPLLVVNTSEVDHVERVLDDILAAIRRTRAGVTHFVPGAT
ncbi:MAG: deoxynucleoside kinase [Deltaproteobacteria bacterium]|nr:deoxynucleoside kinase [Deltaproteobacteria bacterium]